PHKAVVAAPLITDCFHLRTPAARTRNWTVPNPPQTTDRQPRPAPWFPAKRWAQSSSRPFRQPAQRLLRLPRRPRLGRPPGQSPQPRPDLGAAGCLQHADRPLHLQPLGRGAQALQPPEEALDSSARLQRERRAQRLPQDGLRSLLLSLQPLLGLLA